MPNLPAIRKAIAEIGRSALAAAFLLVALSLLASGTLKPPEIVAMLIGGCVGAIELLGRYRHAPLRATMNWSGIIYIVVNMTASWAAYYMLGAFGALKSITVAKELTQVLLAGFGSLVTMRSSLFKVRVGDSDIGVGPAAVLDTLLLVVDRGVDRREAVARAQDVSELVAHVKDPVKVATILTKYSLALMQNVDAATTQDAVKAIQEILNDPEIPPPIKMDIVALRLGVIVGPDVLEAAVAALGDRLSAVPAPDPTNDALVGAKSGGSQSMPSAADLKAEIDANREP